MRLLSIALRRQAVGSTLENQDPMIPSSDRCPVTGLAIRHDPRWVITDNGQKPYRAEFSVIGLNIIHAKIDGFTTIDISKRYLDALDALCDEIGVPVYLLEDYSLHKGTSGRREITI